MSERLILSFCFVAVLTASSALAAVGQSLRHPALCPSWKSAVEVGSLDPALINEASGLAISRDHDRLYHVNDSGDGPRFFITQKDGTQTKSVSVKDFKPFDVEELALGPCPGATGTCLVLGDIGDNRLKRKFVELVFIREQGNFGDEVTPLARLQFEYPDRPHDAEAMAIMPSGDLIVMTKEARGGEARAAHLFRVSSEALARALSNGGSKPVRFEKYGELSVPEIMKDKGFGGLVTGMSVTSDGTRFAVLTYDRAIEVAFDLQSGPLPKTSELETAGKISIVNLVRLPQQEAIAYDSNDRDLVYTTEVVTRLQRLFGGAITQRPSIMKATCAIASSP
jgi:hypothetical protein